MLATAEQINLAAGCTEAHCLEMAWKLQHQLSNGYTHRVSVMPLDVDFDAYMAERRTARKRAARAARLGYRFGQVDRHQRELDIFHINTSVAARQGRPMSSAYMERQHFGPNPVECDHHHVYTYGVVRDETLYAYLWLYRSGELAMVSSILGHHDRLGDDVMYLLVTEAIREQTELGGMLFYNLHSSGTDGLRFFKERLGLAAGEVEWTL